MQKYLREKLLPLHQYTVANFMAAFMWRRPLNSVVSTTTTHRELRKILDGTGTQVKAGMADKCVIKMI